MDDQSGRNRRSRRPQLAARPRQAGIAIEQGDLKLKSRNRREWEPESFTFPRGIDSNRDGDSATQTNRLWLLFFPVAANTTQFATVAASLDDAFHVTELSQASFCGTLARTIITLAPEVMNRNSRACESPLN